MRKKERLLQFVFFLCALVSVVTTIGIISVLFKETFMFFREVSLWDFLTDPEWTPLFTNKHFGIRPLLAGTFLTSVIALLFAIPMGLLIAVYLSEYASDRTRRILKPILEILAGIPTVVYGYFAVVAFSPLLRAAGDYLGIEVASESALAAGVVMGIMITPFIMSLSEDVISAVPKSLIYGSFAMGATPDETVRNVIIPAAFPGIIGAVLLGISRGIGETMIVVMAAGLSANLTANPLEAVTTATVQIVTLLVGDHEFDSPKTLAAFALGFALFIMTFLLNLAAQIIVKRYRQYNV